MPPQRWSKTRTGELLYGNAMIDRVTRALMFVTLIVTRMRSLVL
jgi:hypothetical protein